MADAAISFAVEKLGDSLIQKVKFLQGVEEQVEWLKEELQSMQCFLKDAAEKQRNNQYGNLLRKWISDVREVAQDAEDIIEIFTLKVDTPPRCACFPVHVSHLNRVGEEIQSIQTRLHEIRERRDTYGIGKYLGEMEIESSSRSRSEMAERRRLMAARFKKEKEVVGLNEDADLLLNEVILDQRRAGLSLATIVGMGGVGKSTLARKIYNHAAIADRFKKRAWVVVSSEFVAEDIMKQIIHELSLPLDDEELKALGSIQGNLRRQEMLQQMLRNRLEGERYFIVLDDVWEKTHWEVLKNAFPDEQGKASRVLFTSRNQIITEHCGYVHKMKLLNSDESWELLLKTAFIGRSTEGEGRCPQELEKIGREILEKCQGLPLAITVAGGLLVNQEESKTGWEKVLKQIKNYHLETSEIGSHVSAILELSYHNLPSQLKPCFLCLAFFKEDAVIRAKRLAHIWVALGFVLAGEETVEEIARNYLDELINRNLVQVKDMAIDDRVKNCHVHDLLRELSIKKAKEEIGFESLLSEESSSSKPSSNKPRHRVVRGMEERLVKIDRSNQNKHLRSLFLNVEDPNDNNPYFTTPSYWEGFQLLRILDIEGSKFSRLPSKVRALIGLRYLRLRAEGKSILKLPRWLDVLKNLEVLDIADNEWVTFPDVTWKMDSLRHFYIAARCIFPDSMKKSSWKNLETLKYLRSDELLLGNPIQGFCHRLRKFGVEVRYGEGEAEIGRLLLESEVQVVHLRWDIGRDGDLPIPNSLENLTKLKLHGIIDCFPSADKFPQNITHLTLSKSGITTNDVMQELSKLPKLLVLKLDDALSYTHSQRIEVSHEGFLRLKVFHLRSLPWLKNIEIEEGGMPQLQRLEIYQCPDFRTENLRIPAEIIVVSD